MWTERENRDGEFDDWVEEFVWRHREIALVEMSSIAF
jgi:hypothetical protein